MPEQAPGFGEQLRRYRERAGLSREALAERAELTASGIAALERGRRQRPYPDTVRRLAEALALSADERTSFGVARLSAAVYTTGNQVPAAALPSNLPAPRPGLIGREHAVAALAALVPAHSGRLVTLTGIGGGGKTRLALAVANDLRAVFAGDVWLVELDAIADPTLVPLAATAALAIPEVAGLPPHERLVAALRGRRLLLVVDNCEHLIDACAALAEQLLDGCPDVSILATSREPLQLARERVWRLPPLAQPDPDRLTSLAELAQVPSVQLFVARARAVDTDFNLTAQNAGALAGVCARLDGIPLAIELAAARVRVLTVAQILARLDDSLRLLTGSSRAAPTRQQTLRATLDWSYDLLSRPEQILFQRLAVFAGGSDIEAVEAVCAGPDLAEADVLELLTNLVDKSLVLVAEGDDVARYRLLEPVRQYAAALASAEAGEVVRARHASWYLALAERAAPALRGRSQLTWLARLQRELGNLRAALHWAGGSGAIELEARLALSVAPFLEGQTHLSEGRRVLATVLARDATALGPALRRRVLIASGRIAHWQSDFEAADALLSEGVDATQEADDRGALAESLAYLGLVRMRRGSFTEAVGLLEESLALARELGDSQTIALALLMLGFSTSNQGDYQRARDLLEECLQRFQQAGDLRYAAVAHTQLGVLARRLGDPWRAAVLLRQGLAGHLAVSDRTFLDMGLRQLAAVLSEPWPRRSVRLLAAAERLREALGATLDPRDRANDERTIEAIRRTLTEVEMMAGWAEGRALTLEQAVTVAMVEAETQPPPAPVAALLSESALEPLTGREQDVVRLLAQGCTDREIAVSLGISVRTVGSHVQHLLAKLGLRSRWQVADWAQAHGAATLPA